MGVFAALSRALEQRFPVLAPVEAPSSALRGLSLYDQYSRIGGGLTPEGISTIYRNADLGYTYQLIDLGNECRQRDGHLQGIVEQRETCLGPLHVQVDPFVEPGGTKPTPADAKVALALSTALRECKGLPPRGGMQAVGLRHLKQHLQGGNWTGYAMAETIWQKRTGLLVPTGFYCHSPRRFGFRERDGALVQWDQIGSQASAAPAEVQERWPGRWIQHQPRVTGDVPAREGYGRVLIWCAMFRNWDIADVMKLAEMTWKPYRIGRYKRGTSDKAIQQLLATLQALTNNGVATLPDDVQYEIKWPELGQSTAQNHLRLAEFLGAEMSKAVLHGTLLTEAGDKGARSLGEVMERGFDSVVESDASSVAETLARDIGTPFVRYNYGTNAPVPALSLVTQDEADLAAFGAGVKTLSQDCGMRIPLRWVHDRTGIPKPEQDEEVLGEPTEAETSEAEKEASA